MGSIGVSRKVDPEEAIDTTARRGRAEASANATQYADSKNWRDSRAAEDIVASSGREFERLSYKEMHDYRASVNDDPDKYSYTRKPNAEQDRAYQQSGTRDLKRHAGNRKKN